jgi:endonuclease/exonuclease/phosphatase family metal-dependent hydrolase
VSEPEWTRVRPNLQQKSVVDYVVTDVQLMRESGVVQVDITDIGASDHLLVWLELGWVT